MKHSATGDFCVLYIEATDDKAAVLDAIIEQKKPVVIMLAEQVRVFQRPEDFTDLKHIKRRLDLPIVFVIPQSEHLTLLAGRHGFPVYLSMDALVDAVAMGQLIRQRTLSRTTAPLGPTPSGSLRGRSNTTGPMNMATPVNTPVALANNFSPRKTVPLTPTTPLPPQLSLSEVDAPYVAVHYGAGAHSRTTDTMYPPPPQAARVQQSTPMAHAIPTQPLPQRLSKPSRRPLLFLLVILLVLTLIAAGIGALFMLFPQSATALPAAPPVVGHVAFLSSEQVNENSNQGINDEVMIDLTNVPQPAAQHAYYAWLLSDISQGDAVTMLLGTLPVVQSQTHLFYAGDAHHTNLLAITSRFLVTEESATIPPIAPSPDYTTWRYYAAFAQNITATPANAMNDMNNMSNYSFLDHLRHLLASDPMLNQFELPGGLNTWLYRNVGKIVEWTSSMPDTWQEGKDVGFVRRQTVRVLTYIDGLSFVKQDLPANTTLGINERLAGVGLLSVNGTTQTPPSYLDSIDAHLSGLLQKAPKGSDVRARIATIIDALSNVRYWLQMVRKDAQQIVAMSDAQLLQPTTLTLLNDMMNNATHAYVGQSDPTTGKLLQGVVSIHQQMQALATLDVTPYVAHSSSMQLVPNRKPPMTEHVYSSNGGDSL